MRKKVLGTLDRKKNVKHSTVKDLQIELFCWSFVFISDFGDGFEHSHVFYKAEKRIGLLFDSFQSVKLLFDFQHFQCYLMRCGKRANAALIAAFSFNGNGLAWVGVQPSWQRAVATLKQTKIKIKISKSLSDTGLDRNI